MISRLFNFYRFDKENISGQSCRSCLHRMGIRQEREWNGDGCVRKQLGLPKCPACAGNSFPWAYRSPPWRVCLQVTVVEINVFLQFGCRHLWPEDMFLHSSPLCRSLHTAPDPVQLLLQAFLSLHGDTNYPAKRTKKLPSKAYKKLPSKAYKTAQQSLQKNCSAKPTQI